MPARLLIQEKIASRLELINGLLDRAVAEFRRLPFKEEVVFQLKLALEEAVTNAIRHGNALDPDRQVSVTIQSEDKGLIMIIRDEGKGFDPAAVPDPTSMENKEKPCGRGVFLIKRLMDEVVYEDAGRTVRMTKLFSR